MKNTRYSRTGFAMGAFGALIALLESQASLFNGTAPSLAVNLVAGVLMLAGASVVVTAAWNQQVSSQ